jgi:hypothetical protein
MSMLASALVQPQLVTTAGVAHISRYVANDDREPYFCYAAGLCTSAFGGAAAPERPKP